MSETLTNETTELYGAPISMFEGEKIEAYPLVLFMDSRLDSLAADLGREHTEFINKPWTYEGYVRLSESPIAAEMENLNSAKQAIRFGHAESEVVDLSPNAKAIAAQVVSDLKVEVMKADPGADIRGLEKWEDIFSKN